MDPPPSLPMPWSIRGPRACIHKVGRQGYRVGGPERHRTSRGEIDEASGRGRYRREREGAGEYRRAWTKANAGSDSRIGDLATRLGLTADEADLVWYAGCAWTYVHWAQFRSMKTRNDGRELKNLVTAFYSRPPMSVLWEHDELIRAVLDPEFVAWIDGVLAAPSEAQDLAAQRIGGSAASDGASAARPKHGSSNASLHQTPIGACCDSSAATACWAAFCFSRTRWRIWSTC